MDDDPPIVPILVLPKYVYSRLNPRKTAYTYRCERCNEWFDDPRWSYYSLYHHLHSKRHAERMELHEANCCKLCNLQFSCASAMRRHVITRRHIRMEKGILTLETRCEPCDLNFTCQSHLAKHLTTQSHARKLAPPPQRSCDVCGIKVTTDKQMETHLATKKHQRKTLLSSPPLLETTSSEQ